MNLLFTGGSVALAPVFNILKNQFKKFLEYHQRQKILKR